MGLLDSVMGAVIAFVIFAISAFSVPLLHYRRATVVGAVSASALSQFGITAQNRLGKLIQRIAPSARKTATATSPAAPFATITVTTLTDETTTNGQCSLREAIANANNDGATYADCASGSGADTITFNVAGTITLSSGEMSVTSNITINEGAGNVVISGNNASRIFNVSSSGNLTLNGLTLQNGNTTTLGGGIYNDGTVTLTNCTVTGCTAVDYGGGISNNGTLTLTGSTISNNHNGGNFGGGIMNDLAGSLTVTNTTISGNSAGAGAGIYSDGTLTLTNSTITGNTATVVDANGVSGSGGGLLAAGTTTISNCIFSGNTASNDGGGLIVILSANVKVINCAFSGNTAQDGGGISGAVNNNPGYTGVTTIINSTISGNSSGIKLGGNGTTHFRNSIVANSTGADCNRLGGTINAQYGLIEAGLTCVNGTNSNNLTGDPALNGDLTLSSTSPAINVGSNALALDANNNALTTDLAGNTRIRGGTVDMGAYEYEVPNTAPTITAGGPLSRQAGSAGASSTIATVSDTETAAGSLTVTATTLPLGITVTGITNTSGTITATVTAACNAAVGANTVVLTVTDGNSGTNTANLTITVTANTAPTLTYNAASVMAGSATTINTATAMDNGSITGYSIVSVVPDLTPVPTVNTSGVVSISNAGPSGNHTITVQATDNCGATTNASFTLTVNCQTITVNPASLPNGFQGTAYNQTLIATGGSTPYSFAVTTGSLPGGLNLTSDGELTGTPITAGTFNFTVTATDNNGCTGTRAYTLGLSGTGLQFYPLAHPVRLLDTRPVASGCDSPGAQIPGGTSRTQTAAGRTCDGLTIPANAKALTGNITTVESGGGFLTLYPSDVTRPIVANSNFTTNQVLNNVFTVGVGAVDGAFKIYVTTNTNVVVDITGYYAPPSATGLYFHPLPHPVRLLDTRTGATACFTPGSQLTAGSTTTQLGTTTCDGVLIPAGAQALVGNATTVSPQSNGFLTLFPADATRPLAASSNFQTGIAMNAPFTVGLSPSGQFNIYTAATTDLVVDVLGYFSTQLNDSNGQGLLFNPLPTPVRLLDTRTTGATGCFTPGAQMIGGTAYLQPAIGVCIGIPAAAKAVVGNATTVNVAANGFLTFWPSDATQPNVATSNYRSATVFNRHFTVGLGAYGAFKRFAFTTTDLVIDLSGYFAP